ncbi:MAG: trypsin-like peptidase domain-containing protein [Thermomicrobiales bacterium]|nr:trypsin-like peptidase domain-containing protein [Thermomicrobiales bacterium]
MRFVTTSLAAALLMSTLAATSAQAQTPSGPGQSLATGPMTAWCEPGQVLLSGGYELQGAEPPASAASSGTSTPTAAPPVVFVSSSKPTVRLDRDGKIAQFGWTAVPNTLGGDAGPLTAYAICAGEPSLTPPAESIPPPPPPAPEVKTSATNAGTLNPMQVVEKVGPAVVTVINEQVSDGATTVVPVGSGSGFILDEEGHIITNQHVVAGGTEFVVVLADGREAPATLVGADANSDVAVLKIDSPVPAVAKMGDSEALLPGQPVLALGSPLGTLTNTVTEGIVSALGRSIPDEDGGPELVKLIQHDAAINPGNSGGPLVTLNGEVVGINTLGIVEAQGIFFAVPSETIQRVATELIARGKVEYPYLGLQLTQLDDQLILQWGLPVDAGYYVSGVVPGSPSAAAGMQVGDIVTAVNLERVGERQSLVGTLFQYKPGDTVQLTVQRGLVSMRIDIHLATRPENL